MLNFFYRALSNKKGFTLIEVLVVVAIIGILAAFAAPSVIQRLQDARVGSDEAMIKILNDAIIGIELENAVTPIDTSIADWNTSDITWDKLKEYIDNASVTFIEGAASPTTTTTVGTLSFTGKSGGTISASEDTDGIYRFSLNLAAAPTT